MIRFRPVLVMVLSAVLAACAGPPDSAGAPATTSSAAPGPPPVAERFTPDVPEELRVRNPRDARGIPACELLTEPQLTELGLDPETARLEPARYGEGCIWRSEDESTSAVVVVSTDPNAAKLPDLYRVAGDRPDFRILEVAGHPAARYSDGFSDCVLNVAVADEQVLVIDSSAEDQNPNELCAPARRIAEMVLSNLPPLT